MIIYVVVFFICLFDQLTKYFALKKLLYKSIPVIKGIFHLNLTFNTGAAFGIFKGHNVFFIVFSLIIISFLALNFGAFKNRNLLSRCSVGFIIGGALGNLFDRIRYGFVIDFIDLRVWPVFNLADTAITIGIFLLILSTFLKRKAMK